MARIGTHHFKSVSAAVRYYKVYHEDASDVAQRIADGAICIGPPKPGKNEKVDLDLNGQYWLVELRWYIAAYKGDNEDFLVESEEEAKKMMIKRHKIPKLKRYLVLVAPLKRKT